MRGAEIAYAATRRGNARQGIRYAVLPAYDLATQCPRMVLPDAPSLLSLHYRGEAPGTRLRASYAMSSTDIAYAGTSLRASYAMSAHDAIALRACYAMSGTDIAHLGISLRARYAMSGTDSVWCYDQGQYSRSVLKCESVCLSSPHSACLSSYAVAMRGIDVQHMRCLVLTNSTDVAMSYAMSGTRVLT
eukprot:2719123-Rhodomonas_salina.1